MRHHSYVFCCHNFDPFSIDSEACFLCIAWYIFPSYDAGHWNAPSIWVKYKGHCGSKVKKFAHHCHRLIKQLLLHSRLEITRPSYNHSHLTFTFKKRSKGRFHLIHTRSQKDYFWVKQSEFVLVIVTTQGDKKRMLRKRGWLCCTGEMSFWTPGCCTALEELGQAVSLHAGHINTCIEVNTVNMTHKRFQNTSAN